MHKLTFFPLGNADCCRIDLADGRKLLFDFAAMANSDDPEDLRCDLQKLLRDELAKVSRNSFDVVAFTHLDDDHIRGSTDFFWLEHDVEYQSDERIRMDIMWVPAALITETDCDNPEARLLQTEARYRFKEGKGIRVFSRPERLRDWCENNGVSLDDRCDLVTDAGQLVPEFSLANDEVEFFVHSPFAMRQDDNEVEDRNDDALVMQITFAVNDVATRIQMMSDLSYEVIEDIVRVTEYHERYERLQWDVVELPHHCSYHSLGPDKGRDTTQPTDLIARLYENYSGDGCIIISTSKPIPQKGTDSDEDPQPPHRQAANYYRSVCTSRNGEFVVTMEHPRASAPEPFVIEIDDRKARLRKPVALSFAVASQRSAPRAG